MGYSIMIPFESAEEKKKMKEFLNQNFRTLKEITSHLPLKTFQTNNVDNGFPPHDNLSYIGNVKEPVLGYDYGAGDADIERDYFYSICYWMAVHGGKRVNGRPVFIYDGYEEWVIYINEVANTNANYAEVNEFGYRKISSLKQMESLNKIAQMTLGTMKKRLEKTDKAIKEELERLSDLWKKI